MSFAESIKQQVMMALSQREVMEHEIEKGEIGSFEDRVALFARLENWRRELEETLKFVKGEAENLEPSLLEEMGANGIQNMRIDGLTVFMKESFYCNKVAEKDGVTTDMICDALREHGLGYIVSEGYAASSLKSKVKEWIDAEVEVPEKIAKLIRYGSKTELSTRKS